MRFQDHARTPTLLQLVGGGEACLAAADDHRGEIERRSCVQRDTTTGRNKPSQSSSAWRLMLYLSAKRERFCCYVHSPAPLTTAHDAGRLIIS